MSVASDQGQSEAQCSVVCIDNRQIPSFRTGTKTRSDKETDETQ